MRKINSILIRLLLIAAFSAGSVFGQCDSRETLELKEKPSPVNPINFGELELFLDYALLVAYKCESNLIAIVKMEKNTTVSLAKLRMKRVGDYVRLRGFKDFQVAAAFDETEPGKIELHVGGKLLYTLPLKKKEKLNPPGLDIKIPPPRSRKPRGSR